MLASLLEQTQPSSSQKFADPEAGPSVGSDEDTTVIRRTFARPLDEGYAKNYISRHRQVLDANAKMEAVQKLKDLTTNSIHVVLWTKVNYPPQHFRLVNSQPGKFVPQEHTIVMAAAELEAAGSNARILLRKVSLSDDDCLGLNAEISLISLIPIDEHPRPLGAIAQARRLLTLSSSSTRNSSPEPPSSSKSSPAPPESREPADDKREMRLLPFPLKNVCDMEPAMHFLLSLRSKTAGSKARQSISTSESTMMQSPPIYLFLVTPNGPTLSSKDRRNGIDCTPKNNEDEDELGFDVKNLKLEIYRRSGGILETFSPPDSYMDVIAQYTTNGNLKTIALKKILLPGQWFDLRHNKTVATWVEGARLAECGILWQAFASRVRAVDIDLIGVEVLETFSFCQDDNIYFAQSWECGSKFFVNTWGSDLPIDAPNQVAVVEILTAFSHFTYQHHNHRSVFVDFEEGYRVFDSRTHSLVAMLSYDNEHNDEHGEHADETLQQPFLQSLDAAGIKDFTDTHTCNRVCKALELNSIPLVFPTYKN
ncbi:hypothetical protein C8J57DRAFT_1526186 [Mycena rebaudengoi]|nr:hypothetical protein C8J57DRAFT_1526186 [Mycena rebaudengoi]